MASNWLLADAGIQTGTRLNKSAGDSIQENIYWIRRGVLDAKVAARASLDICVRGCYNRGIEGSDFTRHGDLSLFFFSAEDVVVILEV